jgi:hypothetical protein
MDVMSMNRFGPPLKFLNMVMKLGSNMPLWAAQHSYFQFPVICSTNIVVLQMSEMAAALANFLNYALLTDLKEYNDSVKIQALIFAGLSQF